MSPFKEGDRVRFKLAFRSDSGVKRDDLPKFKGVVERINPDNPDVVHVKWDDPTAKSEFGVHHYALEPDPDVQSS